MYLLNAYAINGFHDVFYVKLTLHGIEKEKVNFLFELLVCTKGFFLICAELQKINVLY